MKWPFKRFWFFGTLCVPFKEHQRLRSENEEIRAQYHQVYNRLMKAEQGDDKAKNLASG